MNLPPYQIFPSLITNRLTLKQIETKDIKDIVEISYYDAVQAVDVQQAEQMQHKINEDYLNGNSIHWGIFDNITNKIVGTCGYYRGFTAGAGELGCVLVPQYYGNGYMTAAMMLAMDYGKHSMKLHRIYAVTSKSNQKAIGLLERLNFSNTAELEYDDLEYEWEGLKTI
ncbi:GNAT family N-acetyltransferase [Flavobacterium sp. NKUCC04_CG]|nr:GNAT family N-acetyltransferase [Flavobacterium sp. NKUCC04_CG]